MLSIDSSVFRDLLVTLRVTLGDTMMSVAELLALKEGSVVTLDLELNGLVNIWLKDNVVGRGEIVAVDDHFGVRLVEVAPFS